MPDSLSHMTNGSPEQTLEADKRRTGEEGTPLARRYGIAARVLFRWKQELKQTRDVRHGADH
jgi:transposase-like protein